MPVGDSKTCTKCGADKPLDAFYKQKDCKDGRRPECRDCLKRIERERRANNPVRAKELERARYLRDTEKRKQRARDHYAANREEEMKLRRQHYAANKETYARYAAKRKALLRGVEHTPYNRSEIYERDGGRCRGCQMALPNDSFEIDHIVPLSLGGPDTPANLQLMCRPCNRAKWMNLEGQIHLPV